MYGEYIIVTIIRNCLGIYRNLIQDKHKNYKKLSQLHCLDSYVHAVLIEDSGFYLLCLKFEVHMHV